MARALELLRDVAAVAESPNVRFSIALCEAKLGRLREALGDYERAHDEAAATDKGSGAKASERAFLLDSSQSAIDELRARVPTVRLDHAPGDPHGLTLRLDGAPVSLDSILHGVRVDPGQHSLRAEAPGKAPLELAFSVIEGSDRPVAFDHDLESIPSPAPPVSAPPPRAAPAVAKAAPPPENGGSWRATAGWVGIGLGAVALGAGVYSTVRYQQNNSAFDDPTVARYAKSVSGQYSSTCDAVAGGKLGTNAARRGRRISTISARPRTSTERSNTYSTRSAPFFSAPGRCSC